MALRGGTRFSVPFEAVFPHGAVFVPDSIAEAQDYDEKTGRRTPSKDKVTGTRVWQCRVMDLDPELGARSREVPIKILTDHQPVPPVGAFQPVEIEGLTVTPYVDSDTKRLKFSFRATALIAPKTLAETRSKAA
ncbi:transcriptional regulator [Micromonospora sp. CP22]|uniref:transcriptional regulator n=1 Tax=Micromonospora sp. CP22 TaxID=2580517 RepID=UPI0012BC5AF5|nr:transcriptional regulator [Micromonospora sp. CP22]MTK04427.1 transcriptional regulator [Micromonospora sp. CP22]